MTEIKSLQDVTVGTVVAYKSNKHYPKWERTTVDKVTAKHVAVRASMLKFHKVSGAAVGKNRFESISIVTPAIQEEWDRKHYTELIHKLLESEYVSSTVLRGVMETMTKWLTN